MKYKIFIVLLIAFSTLFSQRLWEINKPVFEEVRFLEDTSITGLRNIILNKESPIYEYDAAAKFLAYYHEDTEKQFLLENLNTQISQVGNKIDYVFSLYKYQTDQIVLGYLGDQAAISGMDTVIKLTIYESDKLMAIAKLAEARIFKSEYYQFAKDTYLNDSTNKGTAEYCLFYYGQESQYREEVKSLFVNTILNSNDRRGRRGATMSLFYLDKDLTINLLNQLFESQSGDERLDLFYDLGYLDPDGQPERSMWAIPREQDELDRAEYFPDFGGIKDGSTSKKYLKPEWINFLLNWLKQENSDLIIVPIHWSLNGFKPLQIDSTQPTIEMLDSLLSLTDTVYSYNWLGDNNFATELKNKLITARINLENKDSINCAVMIKGFQNNADAVYKDLLKSSSRFITTEGWKFLYYNAQYILNKLSDIPPSRKEIKEYRKIEF